MKKIFAPGLALLASAAVVFVAACSSVDTPTSPGLSSSSAKPLNSLAAQALVQVCVGAGSPLQSYTFTPSAITNPQTGDAASPQTINTSVPGPVCAPVLTRTPSGDIGAMASVTIGASTGVPGTWTWTCANDTDAITCLDGTVTATPPNGGTAGTGATSGTAGENSFHGATVTFNFVPDAETGSGCTYTQGYWKNKGKAATNAYVFDGLNALTVLNTAPKGGNVYIILAHQYIAVTMNVNNGASLTGAALDAYNTATTYFAAASSANPLPSPYTASQITALATVLDNYNNGIIGPGHCGTEVL